MVAPVNNLEFRDYQRQAAGVRACRQCGEIKPLTDFSPHPRSPGGVKSTCRCCERIRQRVRRYGDPDYVTPEHERRERQRRSILNRVTAKGNTYRKFYGRHAHRVAAEQKLGRPLRRGEVVHHLDGNKHNNAPENLEILTQSEHVRRHYDQMMKARKDVCGY